MGKSKGPRVKKRSVDPHESVSIPTVNVATPTHWSRLQKIWRRGRRFFKVVGAILAFLGWAAGIYHTTIPTVHLIGPDTTPFLLPYAVTNTSTWFDMKEASFICGPRPGQTIKVGNLAISGIGFKDNVPKVTIVAGSTANFRCPVTDASGNLFKGTVHPIIDYKTLGFSRTYEGPDQTWFGDANPPRWVEGDMIR